MINFSKTQRQFLYIDEKLIDKSPRQDEILQKNESSEIITEALQKLKPEYRSLIVLKYFQELSYQEISDIMNINEKKVKSQLYSARQILKDALILKGF